MAQLLNIPPNKTLLRRHLATHFNLLIGQEAQQQKREAMESPDYVLLTATAKVKVGHSFWVGAWVSRQTSRSPVCWFYSWLEGNSVRSEKRGWLLMKEAWEQDSADLGLTLVSTMNAPRLSLSYAQTRGSTLVCCPSVCTVRCLGGRLSLTVYMLMV